eukprot:Seg238.5 transcript_id=Seg238.5/GoldUCD/mRNA.D3Y31 product="hypothetical protein" pseudo=true protein_id=Seg238.5/GoldUCD/D3Y31
MCHDAQVVRSYLVSNPLRLTVLAAKSQDYTTAPQHLRQMQQAANSKESVIIDQGDIGTLLNVNETCMLWSW